MGIDFLKEEQVPDVTTLCKFRKLLNDNGITKLLFDSEKSLLDRHGKLMHGETIVDATIIDAPSSTKSAKKQRDPEMHQVKKGNQWYFGERLHAGVDAGMGYIYSMEATAANVNERDVVKADPHFSSIKYRINSKKPYRKVRCS